MTAGPSRILLGALALAGLSLSIASCGDGSARAASGAPTASATATATETHDGEPERSYPEPVYPRTNTPPEPLATKLCDALHALPARRKAACCGGDPSVTMVDECARTLSYALRSKAITLDPADVDRCEAASTKAYEGCDWVTPLSAKVPEACVGIVKGAMKEGDRCRSSLECAEGLRCHGVAASDTGRCGKPKEVGACSRGIDSLAGFTRQTDLERKHPECAGHCNGRRCEADVALGAACSSTLECGTGHRCVSGKCSDAPLPIAGEACSQGMCGGDARCVAGTCVTPKKSGEACSDDLECSGSCEKRGSAKGSCAMLCSAKIPSSSPH